MKLPATPEETVRKVMGLPLGFETGEKFEYSNSGYLLLSYLKLMRLPRIGMAAS